MRRHRMLHLPRIHLLLRAASFNPAEKAETLAGAVGVEMVAMAAVTAGPAAVEADAATVGALGANFRRRNTLRLASTTTSL